MERKIALTFKQTMLKDPSQLKDDLEYWKAKTPSERLAAVTFLVNQNLSPEQRMNKNFVFRKTMKE